MDSRWKPWELATVQLPTSKRRRIVETVSYPTSDAPDAQIYVRMVPSQAATAVWLPITDLKKCPVKYRWVHIGVARGLFSFPEDMLRYDSAAFVDWELHEDPEDGLYLKEPALIYKMSELKESTWTHGRWRSFGWEVSERSVVDLRRCQ
jgi:hypothetical protein